MNLEKQRIAIAEECGWTNLVQRPHRYKIEGLPETYLCGDAPLNAPPIIRICGEPPFYLTDLNAMHEAEKVLTDEQRSRYSINLYRIVNVDWIRDEEGKVNVCEKMGAIDDYIELPAHLTFEWLVHSSAASRAEAFLRTRGKWDES